MYSNLKQEFKTDVALPVASRTATFPGPAINCEPDSNDTQKKFRLVHFTIIAGPITGGTHEVTFEAGPSAAAMTPIAGVTTGPLASDTVQTITLRRGDKASNIKFVRAVHTITGIQAGTVGAVLHRPKNADATNKELDLELVMRHCVYSLGVGAGMPMQSDAIERICLHVRDAFQATLSRNGADPVVEWQKTRSFLLACCEEIGHKAAQFAQENAQVAIPLETNAGNKMALKDAYNLISKSNSLTGGAGEYCPEF